MTPDFEVIYRGSIAWFYPITSDAINWVKDNVSLETWQWLGDSFAVDIRFSEDIVEGIKENNFVIADAISI